jgi:polynucleotide 5'-kinase involved in rRNA processing
LLEQHTHAMDSAAQRMGSRLEFVTIALITRITASSSPAQQSLRRELVQHSIFPLEQGQTAKTVLAHYDTALHIPPSWVTAVNALLELAAPAKPSKAQAVSATATPPRPPVVLACGEKNKGKSTFVRYAINSLLNTHACVAVLELDMSQHEFMAGGFLSLHHVRAPRLGSACTSPDREPVQARAFGMLSPREDMLTYTALAKSLVEHYQ